MEKKFDSKDQTDRALSLEREIQTLRLTLAEKEKTIQHLSNELEQARIDSINRAHEIADLRIENALAEAGRPAVMVMTQAYLFEQDRPIQPRDILGAARNLVRALENLGLVLVGRAGEAATFDPNYHLCSTAGVELRPGAQVRILVPGAQLQGKVLVKSMVEKVEKL